MLTCLIITFIAFTCYSFYVLSVMFDNMLPSVVISGLMLIIHANLCRVVQNVSKLTVFSSFVSPFA